MKATEILLISVVWIVLIAAPVLFREGTRALSWTDFTGPMQTLIPLLIVFAINRFILVPVFLFRSKNVHFVVSAFILIAVVTFASFFFTNPIQGHQLTPMPPPPVSESVHQLPPPSAPPHFRFPQNTPAQPRPIPPFVNVMIFSILLIGFDTGLRVAVRLTKSEQEKANLEKDHMEIQLQILKNQVSPHFFMNTLNNIHALIDINTKEAKEAVIRLSNMMRYLLYETDLSKTSLSNELEFVKSYIDLMKLRYTENITITLNIPDRIPEKQIPPLLFTALIENAFKHGISYKSRSFVMIDFVIDETRLILRVRNSIANNGKPDPPAGIGIENTRHRLDLIYGKDYHLDILNDGSEYNVYLSIPL